MGCGPSASAAAQVKAAEEADAAKEKGEVDLFAIDSFVEWAIWADVAFIDTYWLIDAPLEQIVKRRQDLPAEAFVPPAKLHERPIVSMTYGWSAAYNPDPDGDYAYALKKYFTKTLGSSLEDEGLPYGKSKFPDGAALFWDHKSLYQHLYDPAWDGNWQTREAHLVSKRTPEEDAAFKRALSGMNALYFHASVEALVMEEVPLVMFEVADLFQASGRNDTKYNQRGWTAMECAGACLSGRCIPLKLSGTLDCGFREMLPPMLPADFAQELGGRKFTNPFDTDLVVEMYRQGFDAYAKRARELSVNVGNAVHGADKKCRLLARALPRFEALQELRLEGYPGFHDDFQLEALSRALDELVSRGCKVWASMVQPLQPWSPQRTGRFGVGKGSDEEIDAFMESIAIEEVQSGGELPTGA